jgi:hypothetical protein
LKGDALAALDCDPAFARFVMERAGLAFRQDDEQALILGGCSFPVRLWLDRRKVYVLRPAGGAASFPDTTRRALKLGQFYASVIAGRMIFPTGPALARWKRRALLDWGAVPWPQIVLSPLPADSPSVVVTVWPGIGELLAVRRLTEPEDRLVPLSWAFLAGWCGCDESDIRRALHWLEHNRLIRRAAHIASDYRNPTILWQIAEEDP